MRLRAVLVAVLVGQCVAPDPLGPAERYRDPLLEAIAAEMMASIVAGASAGLHLAPRPVRVHVLTGDEMGAICPLWAPGSEDCEHLADPDGPRGSMTFGAVWLFRDRIDVPFHTVLAHEVAHVLHSPWEECRDYASDCGYAASAVREGHAMYAARLLSGLGAGAPPPEEVDLSPAEVQRHSVYLLGDHFFHWLEHNGLLTSLAEERLPDTSTELLHPELWLAGWEPSLGCPDGFTVGEAGIQWDLAPYVGWPAARAAAAGWDGDCVVDADGAWTSRWSSAADAAEFEAALRVRYGPPRTVEVACAGLECSTRWIP